MKGIEGVKINGLKSMRCGIPPCSLKRAGGWHYHLLLSPIYPDHFWLLSLLSLLPRGGAIGQRKWLTLNTAPQEKNETEERRKTESIRANAGNSTQAIVDFVKSHQEKFGQAAPTGRESRLSRPLPKSLIPGSKKPWGEQMGKSWTTSRRGTRTYFGVVEGWGREGGGGELYLLKKKKKKKLKKKPLTAHHRCRQIAQQSYLKNKA